MNRSILAAIRCSLMFLVPSVTYAISAQWDLDPISGDWNTASNWTANGVPNGPADIATFGLSHTTDVSISANTEVNGITFNAAATNPYTITATPRLTLTISGVGITNNSGITQNFVTVAGGEIRFTNNATGGSNVSISNAGGTTNFFDHSTGGANSEEGGTTNFFDRSTGSALNFIGGTTNFFDRSTGSASNFGGTTNFFDRSTANGAINFGDGSTTNFFDHSTAGSANILNQSFGVTQFLNNSTAGSAFITSFFPSGTSFGDRSSAGSATIVGYDFTFTSFFNNSTAGSATIWAVGDPDFAGGTIVFSDDSTGGTARIGVFARGKLTSAPPATSTSDPITLRA
jgi:hypothetical protein